ncbi:MAG: hypothetical protein EAZ95_10340 [Bacteroidetes bacterium]|nr:MAG: hypothetical protein EAZ95_10340 [Bacteroidota bacterium]
MKKTIVLVGITTVGHHTAFMRLFVDTLLGLGYRVLVLFPEEAPIKDWVMEHRPQDMQDLLYYPYKEPTFQVKNWGRFNEAFAMRKKWLDLARTIRKAQKAHHVNIDFVYFTWIDTYIANYLHPVLVNTVFPYPWSGLYFHPRHYRFQASTLQDKISLSDVDIVFTSKNCHNMTIHDEGIIAKFEKRTGKRAILFPEIADDTAPNLQLPAIQEIQARAKGRTIVVIAGIVDKSKRLADFIALSKMVEQDKFFFVMAGPINTKHYNPEQQRAIQAFLDSKPENCFIYNQYVKEGEEFNSFIAVSDIIFLIYDNFPSSSNRLTKGAIFKKYILTQNRFCTGEDVEKYGLGLTVEEGNLPAALDALNKLRHKILHEPFPTTQFEAYRELHSVGKLKERFIEVLEKV